MRRERDRVPGVCLSRSVSLAFVDATSRSPNGTKLRVYRTEEAQDRWGFRNVQIARGKRKGTRKVRAGGMGIKREGNTKGPRARRDGEERGRRDQGKRGPEQVSSGAAKGPFSLRFRETCAVTWRGERRAEGVRTATGVPLGSLTCFCWVALAGVLARGGSGTGDGVNAGGR